MTEQELKDYVANEVLMGLRSEMDWENTKIPEPIVKRYTVTLDTPSSPPIHYYPSLVSKSPWGFELAAGSTLYRLGGGGYGDLVLEEDVFEDTKQIDNPWYDGNPATGGAAAGVYYHDFEVIPEYNRQSVRAYQAIHDETCFSMNTSDISTITNEDMVRAFARRETWRHIVWATVGDYDYMSNIGGFQRSQIHINALKSLEAENQNIVRRFGNTKRRLPNLSLKTKIKGVW